MEADGLAENPFENHWPVRTTTAIRDLLPGRNRVLKLPPAVARRETGMLGPGVRAVSRGRGLWHDNDAAGQGSLFGPVSLRGRIVDSPLQQVFATGSCKGRDSNSCCRADHVGKAVRDIWSSSNRALQQLIKTRVSEKKYPGPNGVSEGVRSFEPVPER